MRTRFIQEMRTSDIMLEVDQVVAIKHCAVNTPRAHQQGKTCHDNAMQPVTAFLFVREQGYSIYFEELLTF
ncbi:MAG: hypothetical protein HQL31_05145 [Planctomycetes bacterium]|nr:hypothetical protein [Planctomycetota bacterium]